MFLTISRNVMFLTFTDQTNIINIKDLKNPITEGLSAMPGLTTPFLIVSSSGAAFPWHIEEQVSKMKTYKKALMI